MEKRSIDVHKLTDGQISELIEKYTKAGWELQGAWDLSVHQWITFVWTKDGEPPKVDRLPARRQRAKNKPLSQADGQGAESPYTVS